MIPGNQLPFLELWLKQRGQRSMGSLGHKLRDRKLITRYHSSRTRWLTPLSCTEAYMVRRKKRRVFSRKNHVEETEKQESWGMRSVCSKRQTCMHRQRACPLPTQVRACPGWSSCVLEGGGTPCDRWQGAPLPRAGPVGNLGAILQKLHDSPPFLWGKRGHLQGLYC